MEKPILYKRLSELKTSEQGVITKVFGHGSFRNRITEMGFVRGKAVKVIKNAPLLDPIEYEIMGYRIALRKSEAELIEVTVAENAFGPSSRHGDATFRDESVNRFLHEAGKTINVALVGNPNCGKTALFNLLTGARQKVANYAGVTVERKEGWLTTAGKRRVRVLDLPGTYSLHAHSEDERITRDIVTGRHAREAPPELLVCVTDATHLRLNLHLVLEARALGLPMVVVLNMSDMARSQGIAIDRQKLSQALGVPVVGSVGVRQDGASELLAWLDSEEARRLPPPVLEAGQWRPGAGGMDEDKREQLLARHQQVGEILRGAVQEPVADTRRDDRIDAVVLHPGPINRGVEITDEVADGPQSLVLRQVSNGVAIRMAVLEMLLG